MRAVRAIVGAAVVAGAAFGAPVAAPAATLMGAPAPVLRDVTWVGTGAVGFDPAAFRGRVLALLFFRADSDAGLAAFAACVREHAPYGDVAFVALQGADFDADARAAAAEGRAALARHGLAVPHGVVVGSTPSERWAVASWPWVAVVDRAGVVRFEGGARDGRRLRWEIEPLRAAPGAANPLVGQPVGSLAALRWRTPDRRPFVLGERPLTLFRWWTNACEHCTASVPALARLEARHAARGLRLVAVYHPKGRRLDDDGAVDYVRRLGFGGAVAFDDRWTTFLELQRRGNLRRATSVSVLVDAEGVVRWVHLGPRVHESNDARHAEAARDLATLDALVTRLLAPAPSPAVTSGR
jgi:hypothetical protein